MPEPSPNLRPEVILEIASRWRWMFIVPFCLAMIAGMALSIKLPKVYKSSTTILVQPQKVPSNYVKSLVSEDIEERIRTISQQILSWSNLEKVIDTYNLYATAEQGRMLMEEKIIDLRQRIDVNVANTRGGADAFTLSFTGKDPKLVMDVTNGLASYFINENLKVREAQAMGTSTFLEDELSIMRQKLLTMEEALKEYRQQNMGGLPEQLQSNLSILGRLQENLLEKQKALREAKTAVVLLEEQIRGLQTLQPEQAGIQGVSALPGATGPLGDGGELSGLKRQLEDLRLRYTDQHPDVERLQRKIAELEAATTADQAAQAPAEPAPLPTVAAPSANDTFRIKQQAQINQLRFEIAGQEAEIEVVKRQIDSYTKRVEDTPKREQELYSLNRDYENLKEAYNSLQGRKLEADLSVNMEKKQKGEQFQVLDTARLPEKPISPNIHRIYAISVACGLGIGAAVVFLLAFLDQTVRLPEELEKLVGVPMLVAIPSVVEAAQLRRRRWHAAVTLGGVALCAALCGAFGVLTIKGVDRTLVFVSRLLS